MKSYESKFEKLYIPDVSAGLARSHRHVRIERQKEQVFIKLCEQIRFDDFKKSRSDNQRESRKLKRHSHITSDKCK
jgi:hypothetical protein